MTQNIACRIFREQIKLINQLPENERPIVLYLAVNDCFNQFDYQNENQNDNQFENQNENAYVSVSVSVSESSYLNQLSEISKCVLELLKKNIVCKEFSNNYGGKRDNAGRKTNQNETKQQPNDNQTETETETESCIKENNIKEKLVELSDSLKVENKNSVVISSEFKASDYEQLMPYVRQMPNDVIKSVESWIVKTKLGKRVDMNFIAKQFTNFATRQGKPFFKEGV